MFALLALFIGVVAGAPQVPQYQYPVYPQVYPQYQQFYYPQQQLRYIPQYPQAVYPVQPFQAVHPVEAAQQSRGIFGLDIPIVGFQSKQAGFVTDGTVQVIQGNVEFKQNFFTGTSSDYIVYMKEAGDLKMSGNAYSIYISDDCTTTAASPSNAIKITDITAPSFMVNGFYAKGTSGDYNVDGTDGKTSVNGKHIVIVSTDATTTVLGCTAALS